MYKQEKRHGYENKIPNTHIYFPNTQASHALVFFVRGLACELKIRTSKFCKKRVTAHQLLPISWKAVAILEQQCNLWVIAVTSDGAAPNRRFYSSTLVKVTQDGRRSNFSFLLTSLVYSEMLPATSYQVTGCFPIISGMEARALKFVNNRGANHVYRRNLRTSFPHQTSVSYQHIYMYTNK